MLKFFKVLSDSLNAEIRLSGGRVSEAGTWVTVLIGQNGSRKSFLLRQIIMTALGKQTCFFDKNYNLQAEAVGWEDFVPDSLICISGTPLDRFPRTKNISLAGSSDYGQGFLYLGQRATNGMAGTAQSERSLVTAFFLNSDSLLQRKDIFENIFDSIGFKAEVQMELGLGKRLDREMKTWINARSGLGAHDGIEDIFDKHFGYSASCDGYSLRFRNAFREIQDFGRDSMFNLIRLARREGGLPNLVFKDGLIDLNGDPQYGFGVDELELLVNLGVLEVRKTKFFKRLPEADRVTGQPETEYLPLYGSDLSSGQWGWIAGFAGLAAAINEGSLILIDEPENSLHPLWQQNYVNTLNNIIRNFKGAQAVIVTHSPLIASGVDPVWGAVETLSNIGIDDAGRGIVRSKSTTNTFGWKASDVYEEAFKVPSSRSPAFTRTADIALSLLKNSNLSGGDEYQVIKAELLHGIESLPFTDPLRNVFASIVKELDGRMGKEDGQ